MCGWSREPARCPRSRSYDRPTSVFVNRDHSERICCVTACPLGAPNTYARGTYVLSMPAHDVRPTHHLRSSVLPPDGTDGRITVTGQRTSPGSYRVTVQVSISRAYLVRLTQLVTR